MEERSVFASYSEFVEGVLACLNPLLPSGADEKLVLSGCSGGWGYPCSDSATLRGARALYLERLARIGEEVTGVESRFYRTQLGPSKTAPILSHSVYARNIRRWLRGTVPRKRKARADFVLITTCWLFGWGDKDLAFSEVAVEARKTVLGWVDTGNTYSDGGELAIITVLWNESTRSCLSLGSANQCSFGTMATVGS